jgi:hypothetical protein
MLHHYKRVREKDFRQVSQYKPRQYRPKNDGGKVDGQKTPDFCINPIESRINPIKKLTGILTGNSPESHGIGGNDMETMQSPMLPHVLENKAHEGINRQEMEQCGNVQKCNNGEDRICRTSCKLLNDNTLSNFPKTIDGKVLSALGISEEDIIPLIADCWQYLPPQAQVDILRIILQHAGRHAR